MTLAEHLRDFIHNVRIGFARWKVARELRKKRPDFLTKASCGDLELLWEHIDGMPTGRTVFFPPSGVAGIVAGMDEMTRPTASFLRLRTAGKTKKHLRRPKPFGRPICTASSLWAFSRKAVSSTIRPFTTM